MTLRHQSDDPRDSTVQNLGAFGENSAGEAMRRIITAKNTSDTTVEDFVLIPRKPRAIFSVLTSRTLLITPSHKDLLPQMGCGSKTVPAWKEGVNICRFQVFKDWQKKVICENGGAKLAHTTSFYCNVDFTFRQCLAMRFCVPIKLWAHTIHVHDSRWTYSELV